MGGGRREMDIWKDGYVNRLMGNVYMDEWVGKHMDS